MSKIDLKGTTILITGASSGIGREMALLLAKEAKALILVARRIERLEELARQLRSQYPLLKVVPLACDLSQEKSMDVMLLEVNRIFGGVDVLINNAGMGDVMMFEQTSWPKISQMFQTNMIAPAYLTHKLLPGMLKNNHGGILNVSSLAGYFILPGLTSYNGTKFFLTGFTEGLRAEVAGSALVISQLCPGPVRTEFVDVAAQKVQARTPSWMEISARRCAEEALEGFRQGKPVIIPGLPIRTLSVLYKLIPEWLRRELMGFTGKWMRRSKMFALKN